MRKRRMLACISVFCCLLVSVCLFVGLGWRVDAVTETGRSNRKSDWELIHEGVPATRDGEYFSFAYPMSFSPEVEGRSMIPERALEKAVGFSMTDSIPFTVSASSQSLYTGDSLTIHCRKAYAVKKVRQTHLLTSNSSPWAKYLTVYEPIMPDLKFTYLRSDGTGQTTFYTWNTDYGSYQQASYAGVL